MGVYVHPARSGTGLELAPNLAWISALARIPAPVPSGSAAAWPGAVASRGMEMPGQCCLFLRPRPGGGILTDCWSTSTGASRRARADLLLGGARLPR